MVFLAKSKRSTASDSFFKLDAVKVLLSPSAKLKRPSVRVSVCKFKSQVNPVSLILANVSARLLAGLLLFALGYCLSK